MTDASLVNDWYCVEEHYNIWTRRSVWELSEDDVRKLREGDERYTRNKATIDAAMNTQHPQHPIAARSAR